MTNDTSNLGELEALKQLMDVRQRQFLKEQLEMKANLQELLQKEDLSPLEEEHYQDVLKIVDNNIQSFRMSGIF